MEQNGALPHPVPRRDAIVQDLAAASPGSSLCQGNSMQVICSCMVISLNHLSEAEGHSWP